MTIDSSKWFGNKPTGTGASVLKSTTAAITLCASLLVPSGTAVKVDAEVVAKRALASRDTENINPATELTTEESHPSQNLNKILSVFSPQISELAKIFNVSRQTVYNWKHGERLTPENEFKLAQLASAADVFASADIKITSFILKRKIVNNQNLFEIASSGNDVFAAAQTLVSRLIKERDQKSLLEHRFSRRPSTKLSDDSDFIAPNDLS